jgi:folate-binding protein YgfZ
MWQEFTEQQHLQINDGKLSGQASVWNKPAFQEGFVTLLPDTGLIRADGDDAASFLHNQLSNDVEHLSASEVRRAAYCTAKGRMLASFVYWKTDAAIVLQLSKSIQAPVQKRLGMFVLRAKVKLNDVSEQYVSFALGGAQAASVLTNWFADLPATNAHVSNESGTLIRCADVLNVARYQWLCPADKAAAAWVSLSSQLQPTNTADWNLSEIQAGIAHINQLTQEKFVPQMINFELVGGVNFKKGCYPGQEIVARSQYLGKLKRRMTLAQIPAVGLTDGMDVFNVNDGDDTNAGENKQPCGVIVNAEQINENSTLALIEMTLADQESGMIRCGSIDGPLAQLLPLPYEITDITR